tara:strand:- start:57 stop:428 length:372 start_codon:yes stop_codon:yes gene_type:complete
MEDKIIASSNSPLPVLGAFAGELDKAGTFDSGKEFLKNLLKRNKKEEDFKNNLETEDKPSTLEKTQNFINRLNESPLNVSTSGVGLEKKFGSEDQGFNAKIFGNQPFGGKFQYGGQLGFNLKF